MSQDLSSAAVMIGALRVNCKCKEIIARILRNSLHAG